MRGAGTGFVHEAAGRKAAIPPKHFFRIFPVGGSAGVFRRGVGLQPAPVDMSARIAMPEKKPVRLRREAACGGGSFHPFRKPERARVSLDSPVRQGREAAGRSWMYCWCPATPMWIIPPSARRFLGAGWSRTGTGWALWPSPAGTRRMISCAWGVHVCLSA